MQVVLSSRQLIAMYTCEEATSLFNGYIELYKMQVQYFNSQFKRRTFRAQTFKITTCLIKES